MADNVLIFVDGSNLLRAMGTFIDAEINSVKPSPEAIKLACAIVNQHWDKRLKTDANVGHNDGRVLRKYWFGSYQEATKIINVVSRN